MGNESPIITAVMSELVSQRDNVLVQLDLVLNKNILNKGILADVVEETTNLFIKLSTIESSIETVKSVIENNNKQSQINEQVSQLATAINQIQEKNNLEKNGTNT